MAEKKINETPIEKIRNIGIIAHIDAGKTTTTERILYYTGRTYKIGEVHEGAATMDWMEQERERGITITSAATTTFWLNHRINIIDTPGHLDFTAEVERSLRVLDGVVMVLDASEGVQAQTEKVSRQADKYHISRIIFVNKIDKVGADYVNTLKEVRDRLGLPAVAYNIPIGTESDFKGVIDLLTRKALIWNGEELGAKFEAFDVDSCELVDEAHRKMTEELRQELIEKIAETDDELLNDYLEGNEIEIDRLKASMRKAVVALKLVPVLTGTSLRNKGVQPLLDAVVEYLPSPAEVVHTKGINPNTDEEVERHPNINDPFSALAFKVQTDPYVGRLTYFRVYSGKIKSGDTVFNPTKNIKERIGRILLMHANEREEVSELTAGNIGAAVGLKDTVTSETMCDPANPVILETIQFPDPVISLAIEPKSKSDQERLGEGLRKLQEEDPTFKLQTNPDTGQSLISGMGELHLEIMVDRLLREFKVEANVGRPQVAFREAITQPVKNVRGQYIRQSGGRGQYGDVMIDVEPLDRGMGREFVNKIKGGAIPNEFINPIEKGVMEALDSGVLGGYPVQDVRIILVDGSYHDVDSSEIAFKLAGSIATREGVKQAKPVLLEPIMELEVVTPQEFMGDIIGDLSGKRGQIVTTNQRGNAVSIVAQVPLAEMFGYATNLRSMTQGRASFMLVPSHYQIVPTNITEKIVANAA
ncbi:elongation factor G [candidate division WWE3 bacterium]|nr:elongation factor G [candidate division WWE3 bacterium]